METVTRANRWLPLWLGGPMMLALAASVIGFFSAPGYLAVDPCVSGWEVPTGPLTLALLAVEAVALIVGLVRSNSRPLALLMLIVALPVGLVTLILAAGPYGWHCRA